MPPFSKVLAEEGAATKSLKIMKKGIFQTDAVREFLNFPATQGVSRSGIPISGARLEG